MVLDARHDPLGRGHGGVGGGFLLVGSRGPVAGHRVDLEAEHALVGAAALIFVNEVTKVSYSRTTRSRREKTSMFRVVKGSPWGRIREGQGGGRTVRPEKIANLHAPFSHRGIQRENAHTYGMKRVSGDATSIWS